MGLDINSPLGQESLQWEDRAAALFESSLKVRYVRTPKSSPARADAILMKGDDIVGIAETKCRDMTSDDLSRFGDEWLISFDKIESLSICSKSLGVAAYGLLFLIPESRLLVVRLCDPDGSIAAPMRLEKTTTRATVNGGKATRTNAYVSMKGARTLWGHR